MRDGQLRLFPAPQPLVDRLGAEFFRQAPRRPGIYRFYDEAARVLYVGKARDLHARLGSYRRTHGQSRKTIRLIHATRSIDWEVCETETEARLRENALIRALRPRFNRAGTWPWSARYWQLTENDAGFRIDLTADPAGECYGAFRGGAGLALASLARLIWIARHQTADIRSMPRALVASDHLSSYEVSPGEAIAWLPELRSFLAGREDRLLEYLVGAMPDPPDAFASLFVAAQFAVLETFYRGGPRRSRRLRALVPGERQALAPDEYDDLLVILPPDPDERTPRAADLWKQPGKEPAGEFEGAL